MVCERCIKVLQDEIIAANINRQEIELGRLRLNIENAEQKERLISLIEKNGFEIINSNEDNLNEQVIIEILGLFQNHP